MKSFRLAFFVSFAGTSSAWLSSDPRKQHQDGSFFLPVRNRIPMTTLWARSQNKRPQSDSKRYADLEERTKTNQVTMSSVESSTKTPTPALPKSTKKVQISIPRASSSNFTAEYPLSIQVYQVNDVSWWENDSNTNQYGGRCWPSSMAVAEFLVNQHSNNSTLMKNRPVLELGCGPGIPSLAAASCGAQVIATDISPIALGLLKDGWTATSKKLLRKKEDESSSTIGILSVQLFDIFSNDPLPLMKGETFVEDSQEIIRPIVLGCSILYDSQLARGMAQRFVEACSDHNAWVIVGDDDTGERDSGRKSFLDELERLEKGLSTPIPRVWTHSQVQNDKLGWRDKTAHLLHLNPPSSLL